MAKRRAYGGATDRFDIFDEQGTVVVRNVSADDAAALLGDVTADEVSTGVAERSYVDGGNGYRVAGHFAIAG
jgi:hypothetical protein